MGKVVNKRELSEFLGVSQQTLTEWQADEQFPVVARGARGEENQYDTAEVVNWRIAHAVRKAVQESPRDRLTRLQADMLSLDLAEREKQLIPVDQVEPAWTNLAVTAVAFLRGQPSRLAGLLHATSAMDAKRALLKEAFDEFLTRLGRNGEQVESELEALLAELPTERVERFYAACARARGTTRPLLEDSSPGAFENDDSGRKGDSC